MTTLHEMSRQIRTVNDANGFDAPDWDRLLTKLMLVVTELDADPVVDRTLAGVLESAAGPNGLQLEQPPIRLAQ